MKQIFYILRHPEFIDVEGDYGFNQMDLVEGRDRYYANRSCGVAGLSNLLCYERGRYQLSRKEAIHKMRRIIGHMPPMPWGIVRLRRMNLVIRQFGIHQYLKAYRGLYNKREVVDYLIEQISRDKPILMLNTLHPIKNLRLHWVTITEIVVKGSEVKIVISSWGRRYTYRYEELFAKNAGYRVMATLESRKKWTVRQ